jgi:hypothetical protein
MRIRDEARRVVLDEPTQDARTYPPSPVAVSAAPIEEAPMAEERPKRHMSEEGRENIRIAAIARRQRERAERASAEPLARDGHGDEPAILHHRGFNGSTSKTIAALEDPSPELLEDIGRKACGLCDRDHTGECSPDPEPVEPNVVPVGAAEAAETLATWQKALADPQPLSLGEATLTVGVIVQHPEHPACAPAMRQRYFDTLIERVRTWPPTTELLNRIERVIDEAYRAEGAA